MPLCHETHGEKQCGHGSRFGKIISGKQCINLTETPGYDLDRLGFVTWQPLGIEILGKDDQAVMLDVARYQRHSLDHPEVTRGIADLLLDFTIGCHQRVFACLDDTLGQAELVALASGTIFTDQEDGLIVHHRHDHDRVDAARNAFIGPSGTIGELEVDLLDPEEATLSNDASIQDGRLAGHEQDSDETMIENRSDEATNMLDWQNIDTVFLDMDGTLLDLHFDNHFWLEHVPLRYAEARGLDPEVAKHDLLERYRDIEGTLDWYCIDHWSRELGLDIAILKQEVDHLIAVHPHVIELLELLAKRGIRRVLVTNAHQKALALKLSKTQLGGHFEQIVCAHDLKLAKESPGFWSLVQDLVPFSLDRTLFIDDSPSVLHAARAFGFRWLIAVLQPDSRRPARQLEGFQSIHSFSELLPGLRSI